MIEENELRREYHSARRQSVSTALEGIIAAPLPGGQQRLGSHLQYFSQSDMHRLTKPAAK